MTVHLLGGADDQTDRSLAPPMRLESWQPTYKNGRYSGQTLSTGFCNSHAIYEPVHTDGRAGPGHHRSGCAKTCHRRPAYHKRSRFSYPFECFC